MARNFFDAARESEIADKQERVCARVDGARLLLALCPLFCHRLIMIIARRCFECRFAR